MNSELAGLPRPVGVDWQSDMHGQGAFGMVRYADPSQQVVVFYQHPTENEAKSRMAGRKIFEDVVHVRIHAPGERLNVIDRPVREEDKMAYPKQWSQFLNKQVQIPEGTPIDLLFVNHPSIAEMLRAQGVFTIEQCAKLSANALDTLGMGAQEFKNKAIQYLDSASSGAEFLKMERTIEEKDQEIRVLNQKVNMLMSQVNKLTAQVASPYMNSMQPPFIPNYDAQAERINNNAPTKEEFDTRAKEEKKKPRSKAASDDTEF